MWRRAAVLALVLLFAHAPAANAATKKKPRPTPTPRVTPTATPIPLLKAAGACVSYDPGQHLVLAEVGQSGRVFRIDDATVIAAKVRKGARLRVLYLEGPDGPVARRILPGPVETGTPPPPTPAPKS